MCPADRQQLGGYGLDKRAINGLSIGGIRAQERIVARRVHDSREAARILPDRFDRPRIEDRRFLVRHDRQAMLNIFLGGFSVQRG